MALRSRCWAPIFSMIIDAAPRIVCLAAGVLDQQARHQRCHHALDLVLERVPRWAFAL
jgi:hypothetical protein